ncbi:hypothetical protein PPL_03684 [Heterostelium album PN500]|uniref:Uncharacterized protein n=1 Tax=Heterostelium pallidum (strain ATCC 26659 / Pp 5 / PN500) TaxID=670386 RepID=D3B6D6_HETP5|nr:hypothetical protein PPL_03684 [Heterostelium album PN500]EFA82906.1 hypothetical protein PPL_03684 [Heterostelium album PN500]|eukprot:XP_020435023.1 hypothetical protein PPL_03684 [Heterostelium album PN500]
MTPQCLFICRLKAPNLSSVSESIKNSIRKEADNIKELTEKDFPVVLQTVTSLSNSVTNTVTSTVTNTVAQSTIHLSVSQLKDSCQDVDLYNGSLLLRTYEIKRTNDVILAERAEEVDKKIGPLVRT